MWLLTLQLLKNSIDTQGKLRLNLHSLSMSVSKFLEYRRYCASYNCVIDLYRKHAGHIQQIFSQYRRLAFSGISADLR
jgi:hypothetical protein